MTRQNDHQTAHVRFGADYLLASHTSPDSFVAQVGGWAVAPFKLDCERQVEPGFKGALVNPTHPQTTNPPDEW
jgi:hypothetical protein